MKIGSECKGTRRMTATQGSGYGNGQAGQAYPERTADPLPKASPSDRLEYIAAMLQELRIMSQQTNCRTLSDLLGRAHREAERRRREER
jgi:hypothetical protein